MGDTIINFYGLDESNKTISFGKTVGGGGIGSTTLHYNVVYHYEQDSITYLQATSTGHYTSSSLKLHTY